MSSRGRSGWAGALLVLATVAGCGRPVENRAEHAITDLLPRYLGPAEKYTAHVSGRIDAIYRGRLRSVHIDGVNVALLPNLLVNRLTIDIRDVSVDRSSNTIQHVGDTRFSARLTEDAINRYVTSRSTTLRDLHITLGANGKAVVRARPELLGFATVPVSLTGTVRLQSDGTHLDFQPDRASVDVGIGTVGTAIPGFVADHIASRVNPVADLSAAPFPIVAESVTVESGAATVVGHVPPGELQKVLAGVRD